MSANKGLWYNIHKKRESGRPMRKKGDPGAPTEEAMRRSQTTSKNKSIADSMRYSRKK